jgi:hypothetical protein
VLHQLTLQLLLQLEAKYADSGAEETGDSAGLIIIGLAIAAMIVGFIIRVVRKG